MYKHLSQQYIYCNFISWEDVKLLQCSILHLDIYQYGNFLIIFKHKVSDWYFYLFVAALGTDVFEMEKPLVFTYEEIFSSTDGFSDSSLLGHGTYGSVYYALLREQVCSCLLLLYLLRFPGYLN